jgi:hypothetical protein
MSGPKAGLSILAGWRKKRDRRMNGRTGIVAMAVLAVLWGGLAVLVTRALPAPSEAGPAPVLAVFAPATAPDAALARIVDAGGLPLRPVLGTAVWLVQTGGVAVEDRLRAGGAWAVLPPPPLALVAAGCAGVGAAVSRPLPQAQGR